MEETFDCKLLRSQSFILFLSFIGIKALWTSINVDWFVQNSSVHIQILILSDN